MILVIDFGGQTAHLISRRIRDLGVQAEFFPADSNLVKVIKKNIGSKLQGIILSGGPMSVYEKNSPVIDKKVLDLGVPVLGICYGFQLVARLLGGKVISGRKEYGPARLRIKNYTTVLEGKSRIANGLAEISTVWMNHGDEIVSLPKDFQVIGETDRVPYTFSVSKKRNIYGILFHPEAEHTEYGAQILKNFLAICGYNVIARNFALQNDEATPTVTEKPTGLLHPSLSGVRKDVYTPEKIIKNIKQTVGTCCVIGAVSGGVDSAVAAALVAKAIGKQFKPIFVNNGLMRPDAEVSVQKLAKEFSLIPVIVECEAEMLQRLKGITDSEEKRKVIGNHYIEVFEREMEKLFSRHSEVANASQKDKAFLLQGTIYSDVIESQGTKYASKIKSHHNVGGLPEKMKLKLLEPLREFYKDEVRELGRKFGLAEEFVLKQPFPGPGFAVRIRGEVTKDRLDKEKHADAIVLQELENAGWLDKVFVSFPVMTNAFSTAVKGDGKFFGEVIALRVVESKDIMTAAWSHLPYDLLQRISSRIVNEVRDISRVVYDISTKPPATMEWE